MFISPQEPPKDWSSEDRAALKNFLDSAAGHRFLGWLGFWCPDLSDGECPNKTLVASGVHKGYEQCVERIFSLLSHQPAELERPPKLEYPSLDDESQWDDDKPKQ